MIIDCHMHVWPDHIAAAMRSQRPAGLPVRDDGTLSGLLRTLDEAGIDKLGFEYLDGPITPKPEAIPGAPKPKRVRRKPPKPRGGSGGPPSGRGSLPKIPLVRV